jgi:hypothetical protein
MTEASTGTGSPSRAALSALPAFGLDTSIGHGSVWSCSTCWPP